MKLSLEFFVKDTKDTDGKSDDKLKNCLGDTQAVFY
jgi:hypothetical protein